MSVPPVNPVDINAHSEQALVELYYIKTANEVLGSALGGLQQAIQISTEILKTLNALQQQKNMMVVSDREVPSNFSGSVEDYMQFASQYFGQPIVPSFAPGFDSQNVLNLRDQLAAQLSALAPFVDTTDPNGLYQQAQKIVTDIGTDGAAWVMDKYDQTQSGSASQAGGFQNNLSLAITASVSLSDTQKEKVRNYLFIFEEYYKSAGAILSKITSIIESMARNISRG